MPSLSITQSNIQTALVSFLSSLMPSGMPIFEGQDNRVPEPTADDFIVFTVINRERLETNVHTLTDCAFTASISGTVMNVTQMLIGTITPNSPLSGSGVAAGTIVTQGLTGTGSVGTYSVNIIQSVPSTLMSTGNEPRAQPTLVMLQIDVHGPNSSDNAQIVSTMFRSDYAVGVFQQSGFDIAPLYADDPKQIPFTNAEQQVEYRWVIEARLQANQIVLGIPQQFFSTVTLNTESVTVAFPH